MKKTKIALVALLTCLLFTLTGCDRLHLPSIGKTAENFLQALVDADYDTMEELTSSTALNNKYLKLLDIEKSEADFYEGMGFAKETFDEEAQEAIAECWTSMAKNMVQDYELKKITIEDGVGTVEATITMYSLDSINQINDIEVVQEKFLEYMPELTDEFYSDLLEVYENEGEEAMLAAMTNSMLPYIAEAINDLIANFETEDVDITLTIKKVGSEWVITHIEM